MQPGNTITTTVATRGQKIDRTWWQYLWELDSEVIDIQNKYNEVLDRPITFEQDDAFFSATTNLQHFKYKTDEESANIETIEYKNIKRTIYANYYNIVSYNIDANKKVIITLADPVNAKEETVNTNQIKLALAEETGDTANITGISERDRTTLDSGNQVIKNVRAKIDNSIKYKRLNLIQQLWFGFKRFWHSYHSKPLRSTIYTWIAIAALLYLQAGILSFTPVSTILLGATIFLTIPLVSSLFYIRMDKLLARIADDGKENEDHGNDYSIKKIARSLGCNPKMQATLALWTIALAAITTFCVAVANSLAYSMFLTASATSFMLFPASLWGCFAVAAIAGLILFSLNASSFKGGDMFNDAPISTSEKQTILGIDFEEKSVLTLLGESIRTSFSSALEAIKPAFMAVNDVIKNDPEAQKIITSAISESFTSAGRLAAQSPALLETTTTDREPLTENSANGERAHI